jgi:hypothetical protein
MDVWVSVVIVWVAVAVVVLGSPPGSVLPDVPELPPGGVRPPVELTEID